MDEDVQIEQLLKKLNFIKNREENKMENKEKLNLWQKISAISGEIGYLQKDDNIGFGNNSYKAISSEKVVGVCSEKMVKYGVVIYPIDQIYTRTDEKIIDRQGLEKFNRISEVSVKYEVVNIDNPSEKIVVVSQGTGVDTQDKGVGKAMTYAYKNMLIKLFNIATGDDTDKVHSEDYTNKLYGNKGQAESTFTQTSDKPSDAQMGFFKKLCGNHTQEHMIQWYNQTFNKSVKLDTLNKSECSAIIKAIQDTSAKK